MERKQQGMGKIDRAEKYRENCWNEQRERERERESRREIKRKREKYLSLPEIPGMNGSINSRRVGENYWMECSEYMP